MTFQHLSRTSLLRRFLTSLSGLLCALSVCMHAFLAPTFAQDAELSGFVLVNCVASPQSIGAAFNGKPVVPAAGLGQGRATSGLGVSVGSGILSVTHPELESAETALEIAVGATPIVVVYVESQPAPGKEAKKKLAVQVLQSKPSKEPLFRVFFAGDRNTAVASVLLNGSQVSLSPWRSQTITGRSLKISAEGNQIGDFTIEGDESCAVFLARNEDRRFFAVLVPEIIYRW